MVVSEVAPAQQGLRGRGRIPHRWRRIHSHACLLPGRQRRGTQRQHNREIRHPHHSQRLARSNRREMAGFIELARWWRCRQRQDPGLAGRLLPPHVQAAKPRTQLLHVARSGEGKRFLQSRVTELQGEARMSAETAAAIGSMLHLLGELDEAEVHLQRAVDRDTRFKCQLERVRRERCRPRPITIAPYRLLSCIYAYSRYIICIYNTACMYV